MRYGRGALPKGFLPVFSVDTEEEAKELIALCCPTDIAGNYYARELAEEQTLENLQLFSDKLAKGYEMLQNAKRRKANA